MSNGFAFIASSLDHNFASHLRVQGAEVGKSSGLGKCIGELFVCIQYLGLEHTICADNRVRNIIALSPKLKLSIFTSAVAAAGC
jgi:hypothetical protein